jgi:hypothetical protein
MAREGLDAHNDSCPDDVHQDSAGWLLNALAPLEARNFAKHLLACRACRLALDELQPAAKALLALSSLQPPEHLVASTLARVRRTAGRT